jgi:hypothetical protein
VPAEIELLEWPLATAIALMVSVAVTEIGAPYNFDEAVGVDPSVV